MTNQWLRLWHDLPNDPKWLVIAAKSEQPISLVIATYIHMLVNASQSPDRGTLHNWSDEDVSFALQTTPNAIERIRTHMNGKVLDGVKLIGWSTRQPRKEDGAAERARAWREKKKQEANAIERIRTQSNVDKDTDKDKEDIKRKKIQKKKSYTPEFEEWWVVYPRKDGSKADAFKRYQEAIKEGVTHGQLAASARAYAKDIERNGVGRKHIAHATTWLNGRRWESSYDNGQPYHDEKPGASEWRTAEQEIRERRFGGADPGRTKPAAFSDQQTLRSPETIRQDGGGTGNPVGRLPLVT